MYANSTIWIRSLLAVKRKLLSLGFTVLFKLLRTSTIDIIKDSRYVFGVKLPSVQLTQQPNLNEPTIALI